MVRVLLIGPDTIMVDSVKAIMEQDEDVEVLRLNRITRGRLEKKIREYSPDVVITVNEGKEIISSLAGSLSRLYNHFRLIEISLNKEEHNVIDRYQTPDLSVDQLFKLIKNSIH